MNSFYIVMPSDQTHYLEESHGTSSVRRRYTRNDDGNLLFAGENKSGFSSVGNFFKVNFIQHNVFSLYLFI